MSKFYGAVLRCLGFENGPQGLYDHLIKMDKIK